MFALMRTKRKLVCKPPEVDNSRHTNQPTVLGWEIRGYDCGVGSQHGSQSSGVSLDLVGNNDTVGLTLPSNRQVPGVDLSILPDDLDNTNISVGHYNIGLDISTKRQRVRQSNSILSDGLSLHVSRMPVADNSELQSQFASIGCINRSSTTRRQHNDDTPYSVHGGTSSNQQSRPCTVLQNYLEFIVGSSSSNARPCVSGLPAEYKDIGGCTYSCQHCGALFWYEECLRNNERGARPCYNRCYKGGRVALQTYQIYPEYIKLLLQDRHFLENIRAYNQMFSMALLGAQIDESINNGRGPYVFKISGQLYHWIGSLCAAEGLFRTAREKFQDAHIPNFKVWLCNVIGAREYELPTGDMLGAIVYETGPKSDMDYYIVLEERSGYPQRVNKLHPSYMSLQFPLIFIYGEDGYSKELKKKFDPVKTFQQKVGVTSSSSEQKHNRIDYIREHQNDIRNKYLSGIYDAINQGDNDGSDCGSRLILPQSFTGGPRYMYSHYLDALAICRVHDREDIVDRVFKMKIHEFISFLRDAQPFGKIVAVLYNVEFQKRGLPHCHTLLWIDDRPINKSSIGRLTYVHPAAGDLFYLRMLLYHQTGCRSFLGIQTVNDIVYPTCQAACEALGLLEDDQEWETTLQEAALTATPAEFMSEDIPYTSSISLNIPNLQIDDSDLEDYMLYELEGCLNHYSRSLTDFGLHLPPQHLMTILRNRLLMEEKSYDRLILADERDRLLPKLNHKQRYIFNLILDACFNNMKQFVFVYGHDGTDRTLRDVLDDPDCLFGGKTVMLRGDFRQTLPVKKENMRLNNQSLQPADRENVTAFAQWLLDIRNGHIGTPDESDPENTTWIHIPKEYCIPNDDHRISTLINFIYDDDTLHNLSAIKLQEKAIVCSKNDVADAINAKILSLLLGKTRVYISYDDAIPHGHDGGEVEMLYPREYLNTLSFPGLPPHRLELKVGTPVMLLCNVNIVGGLCNETRLIVTQLLPKVIEAQVITGTKVSQKVFLPRILLTTKDPKMPFIFKRK
ncbi:DNA helicase [Tanacetum coccineum]